MKIVPLTQDRIKDWLDFFDNKAFCDNPSLQSCYCTYFHKPKASIADLPKAAENRGYAVQLINANYLCGYQVYDDQNKTIAWCSVNKKQNFFRTPAGKTDDEEVLSIMCFVVMQEHRGKGITSAIVKKIIQDAKQQGIKIIESYPRKKARTPAGAFHGGYEMYKEHGFVDCEIKGEKCMRRYLG
ncbi:MAG: GNAT family N-acetyltransferase [Pseudomonadota bacterium]